MPTPWPPTGGATASDAIRAGEGALRLLLAALTLALPDAASAADPRAGRPIIQCELNGKKVTSDRLISECIHKEQRELNPDGSLKRIIPPTLTADELAAKEQQERDTKAEIAAKGDAVRRDRNLMHRFPDEAAHRKAREKVLDEFSGSVKNYQARIVLLLAERKRLKEEADFYGPPPKQPMPAKLKQQIDANDASLEAQNGLVQNQQAEITRINALYDAELGRLRKLWAGAPAGSLGPLPQAASATPDALKATSTK